MHLGEWLVRRNLYDAKQYGYSDRQRGREIETSDVPVLCFAEMSESRGIAQEDGIPEHVRPSSDRGSAGWMLQDGACTHMPRDRSLEMEFHARTDHVIKLAARPDGVFLTC